MQYTTWHELWAVNLSWIARNHISPVYPQYVICTRNVENVQFSPIAQRSMVMKMRMRMLMYLLKYCGKVSDIVLCTFKCLTFDRIYVEWEIPIFFLIYSYSLHLYLSCTSRVLCSVYSVRTYEHNQLPTIQAISRNFSLNVPHTHFNLCSYLWMIIKQWRGL